MRVRRRNWLHFTNRDGKIITTMGGAGSDDCLSKPLSAGASGFSMPDGYGSFAR